MCIRDRNITIEMAREVLPRAVATQGSDFVYSPGGVANCYYEPQKDLPESDPMFRTACLIGVALDLLGFTEHHEMMVNVNGLWERGLPMDLAAKDYFLRAQRRQDGGRTWGEALQAAEDWW